MLIPGSYINVGEQAVVIPIGGIGVK